MTESGRRSAPAGDAPRLTPQPDAGAPTDAPRHRFRTFLTDRTPTADAVAWYLDEVVPALGSDPGVQLALEELVDQLGRIAGFDVIRPEGETWATWTSGRGARLLVWAADTGAAIGRMGLMLRLAEGLRASGSVPPGCAAGATCVLAGAVQERRLAEAAQLRRTGGLVQFVTVTALLQLARACEVGDATHADALLVLQPAPTLADTLIRWKLQP